MSNSDEDKRRRSRGGFRPSFAGTVALEIIERAQGRPGAVRTHGPPATRNAGGSHHRYEPNIRPSLRGGVNAYGVLSPGTGLSCPRRPQDHPCGLDASVGASGPHAFAVRDDAARLATSSASTASPPHVRDDRDTPLSARRDGAYRHGFGKKERDIFGGAHLGDAIPLISLANFLFCRSRFCPLGSSQKGAGDGKIAPIAPGRRITVAGTGKPFHGGRSGAVRRDDLVSQTSSHQGLRVRRSREAQPQPFRGRDRAPRGRFCVK